MRALDGPSGGKVARRGKSASKSEGNDGFVSRYCRQAAAAVATQRGMREVSKDDPSVARAEDGGTITTTEIEFSHQSSRCEESACTHASIRPASRISRVSTGCASGEREGEGGREREGKREPTVLSFLLLLSRQRGGIYGWVHVGYVERRSPQRPLYAIPVASASFYLPRETKHGSACKKKVSFPAEEISIRVTVIRA